MNVLITNDDGIDSVGITTLAYSLVIEGHRVFTFAPDGNRSAISQGISLAKQLNVKQIDKNSYKCSGTPCDCVILGLKGDLFSDGIDVVVSGINAGGNLGTDILYSGTCAAARQAVLYGVPGIAVSLELSDNHNDADEDVYLNLGSFIAKNLQKLSSLSMVNGTKTFVNINAVSDFDWKGVKITGTLSEKEYDDIISIKNKNFRGIEAKYFGREPVVENISGSDYEAVEDGYISVSQILVNPVAVKPSEDVKFEL